MGRVLHLEDSLLAEHTAQRVTGGGVGADTGHPVLVSEVARIRGRGEDDITELTVSGVNVNHVHRSVMMLRVECLLCLCSLLIIVLTTAQTVTGHRRETQSQQNIMTQPLEIFRRVNDNVTHNQKLLPSTEVHVLIS